MFVFPSSLSVRTGNSFHYFFKILLFFGKEFLFVKSCDQIVRLTSWYFKWEKDDRKSTKNLFRDNPSFLYCLAVDFKIQLRWQSQIVGSHVVTAVFHSHRWSWNRCIPLGQEEKKAYIRTYKDKKHTLIFLKIITCCRNLLIQRGRKDFSPEEFV